MHQWEMTSRAIPRTEARVGWWPGAPSPPAPRGKTSWLELPPTCPMPTNAERQSQKGRQKPNGSNNSRRISSGETATIGEKKEQRCDVGRTMRSQRASWAILGLPRGYSFCLSRVREVPSQTGRRGGV
eukprot:scaffold18771_cov59-Phaeocystis_antarctica.AAC.4